MSIGVYFGADWCPSCTEFTPLLNKYYGIRKVGNLLNNDCSPFQVVLVLWCKTSRDTHNFFEPMPWAALLHLESMGERGQLLMTRFVITTIPALVLLDGSGTVVCLDGRRRVTSTTTGQSPALSDGLPLEPLFGPTRASKPRSNPPTFVSGPWQTTGELRLSPTRVSGRWRPAPPADIPLAAGADKVTQSSMKRVKPRPPPKPNLMCGKGAVTFSLPPCQQAVGSPARKLAGRPSPKMAYVLTPAQLALMAGSTDSAPQDSAAEGGSPSEPPPLPPTDIPQGKQCLLMQPRPLAGAHPFTPVMKEWRHGIKVDCGPDWS
jgi:hypothetical protein